MNEIANSIQMIRDNNTTNVEMTRTCLQNLANYLLGGFDISTFECTNNVDFIDISCIIGCILRELESRNLIVAQELQDYYDEISHQGNAFNHDR